MLNLHILQNLRFLFFASALIEVVIPDSDRPDIMQIWLFQEKSIFYGQNQK